MRRWTSTTILGSFKSFFCKPLPSAFETVVHQAPVSSIILKAASEKRLDA